jgi:hypothetical protein
VGALYRDTIEEALADQEKITDVLAIGVRDALKKHKQAGYPVIVWRDGKIVWLKPEEIHV